MAKRYYLCDIVTRQDPSDPSSTLVYPKIVDFGVKNFVAHYPPQDVDTGLYADSTVLCLVADANHQQLQGVEGIDQFPDFPLHGRMSAMATPAVNAVQAALQKRGMPVTWTQSQGWGEVLRAIGTAVAPGFHEANFDVLDV
jgi:hypothetical protein